MDTIDILLQFSEIAVAFAGFSGIVAALGGNIVWDEKAVFRFQNLLLISVSVVFLGLLPIALIKYETDVSVVWTTCSVVTILLAGLFFLFRAPIARRVGAENPDDRVTQIVGLTFLVSLLLIIGGQILGITGLLPIEATYISGLLIMLFLSATQFGVLCISAIRIEQRGQQ